MCAYHVMLAVTVGSSDRPLIGEIDCVVEDASGKALLDWKTSARRWPKDQADKSFQPTVYLYARHQLHPQEATGFRFDVVVKNKIRVLQFLSPQVTSGQDDAHGSGGRARTYNLVINSHPLYH